MSYCNFSPFWESDFDDKLMQSFICDFNINNEETVLQDIRLILKHSLQK